MTYWEFDLSEMNRHLWAFWYFCRRKGDRCWVDRAAGKVFVLRREG